MNEEGFLRTETDRFSTDRWLALLWGGVVLLLLLLSPWAAWISAHFWPCPFKMMTGFACPFCGTTRAALALARFDWYTAVVLYPLPTVLWIAFLVGGLFFGWRAWRGFPLPRPKISSRGMQGLILMMFLLNWLYSIATGV